MLKRIFAGILLAGLLFTAPVGALQLDPIPEGINIVVLLNNHSNLPLGDILANAPIPPDARQKIDGFINETGFNPFRDLSMVQIMGKKMEEKKDDDGLVVLTGKIEREKIMAFLKKVNAPVEEDKLGDQVFLKGKDGKGAICFFGNEKAAVGKIDAVKSFIEARQGKAESKGFDSLKGLINDKAYVTIMVSGPDLLKREMDKKQAKYEQFAKENPDNPKVKNPVNKWLRSYLLDGVAPSGIFANLLDDKFEAKAFYDRGEAKGNTAKLTFEISEPKLKIETVFLEFLKIIPQLKPPEKK